MARRSLEEELIGELAGNFTDGASVLARRAIELIQRVAREAAEPAGDRLTAFADRLAAARPSMYAIAGVLREWRTRFDASPVRDAETADAIAGQVLRMMDAATDRTVEEAAGAMRDFHAVLTHSASSTVRRVIEALGKDAVSVIVTESKPGGEGRGLAAALEGAGFRSGLVADEDAAEALRRTDVFAVGADAVLAGGDVVNKVGTRALAEAARPLGIPTMVVAESFKNAPRDLPLESIPGGDDPLFDVTPARLITRRICDNIFTAV